MDFSAWSPSHLIAVSLRLRYDYRASHRGLSTAENHNRRVERSEGQAFH